MRSVLAFLVFASVVLVAMPPSFAERRVALVIGNGDYLVGPLKNSTNDARLIAKSLEATGFEVTLAENLGYRDLQRAVIGFGRGLRSAGKEAVGMIYYAGHAVQSNGQNYLIPIDAELEDELDLEIQALALSTMMRSLDSAGNRLNMVVLEACRNNPFKTMNRSAARGLAKVDAPQGTLIAYSTAPGDVALDGSGQNSAYTEALAAALREPGLPVEQVFKKVRIAVMEKTDEAQVPWESSSLIGDFYFEEAIPAPGPEVSNALSPHTHPQQAEIAYWQSISNQSDAAGYIQYLEDYPEGLFAVIAKRRLEALDAQQANEARQSAAEARDAEALALWQTLQSSTEEASLQNMVSRYPDTVYADLAKARIQTLRAAQQASEGKASQEAEKRDDTTTELVFWQSILNSPLRSDYEEYLERYPDGLFATIAQDRVDKGHNPQLAALTPGPLIPDGAYTLSIQAGGSQPWPWCRSGEFVEQTVTLSGGKFGEWVRSNFGTNTNVSGQHVEDGAFLFRMFVQTGRKISAEWFLTPQGSGTWIGDKKPGEHTCPVVIRLTR